MAFAVRAVTIAPGQTREIDTRDYAGALVLVQGGAIELVCGAGVRRRFGDGDMIWIEGLGVRTVENVAGSPATLVAIARGSDEPAGPGPRR